LDILEPGNIWEIIRQGKRKKEKGLEENHIPSISSKFNGFCITNDFYPTYKNILIKYTVYTNTIGNLLSLIGK
jgi:hypothetical protein